CRPVLLPQDGDLLPASAGASGSGLPGVHHKRHLVRQLARRDQLLLRLAGARSRYRPVLCVGSLDPNEIRFQQCSPHLCHLHGSTHCRFICFAPGGLSRNARRRAHSHVRWPCCLGHRIHRPARLGLCGKLPRPSSPTPLGKLGRFLMPDRAALFPSHLLGRTGRWHASVAAGSAASSDTQQPCWDDLSMAACKVSTSTGWIRNSAPTIPIIWAICWMGGTKSGNRRSWALEWAPRTPPGGSETGNPSR